MATQTLTAMFDSYDRAAEAVRQLEAAGVPHSDVSIVSNDASHQQYYDRTDDATGTGTGASLGTLLGGGAGLLAGLGMLAIPGLGPVVAAGWLASTLVGAGVGAAAGGVVGGLTDAGVSHEHATAYAEGIRRGGTLVTARVDQSLALRASDILDRDGTIDMDEREANWRTEGWTGSNAGGAGLTGSGLGGSGVMEPGLTGSGLSGSRISGSSVPGSGLTDVRSSTIGTGSSAGLGATLADDARRAGQAIRDTASNAADSVTGTEKGLGTGMSGVRRTSGRVRVYDGL